MAEINQERVRETTTVTSGNVTLLGATPNHRTFASVCALGDIVRYTIVDTVNSAWESGIGLYSAANTIQRLSVDASSNTNNFVTFAAGTKDIFINEPAFSNEQYPSILPKLNLAWANGEFLDPNITFTRTSIATRVNSIGLLETVAPGVPRFDYDPLTLQPLGLKIEETRTNIVPNSNSFSYPWGKNNITADNSNLKICGGSQLSYFTRDTTSASCYAQSATLGASVVSGTTYTLSMKCSIGTAGNYIGIRLSGAYPNRVDAVFNLSTGAIFGSYVGGTWTSPSATITKIGNGSYLVTATGTCGTTESANVVFGPSDASIAGAGFEAASTVLSNCYAGEVQVEAYSFKTSYIPSTDTFTSRTTTGTYYGSDGLLKTAAINAARYQYNPSNLSAQSYLLLEPASTNYVTYSQDFSNANWVKANSSVGTSTTAPDGTVTGQLIIENTATGNHGLMLNSWGAGANLVPWTFSFFVKPNGRNIVDGWIDNGSGIGVTCKFDLSLLTTTFTRTGSSNFGNLKSSIIPLPFGWYRCIMTATNTVAPTGTMGQCRVYLNNGAAANDGFGSVSYTGDGVSGASIWGAQMEQTQFATSYIATTSVTVSRGADVSSSAQTTRQGDVVYSDGAKMNSWINQVSGTFVANYIGGLDSTQNGYGRVIGYKNNTYQNATFLSGNGSTTQISNWNGVTGGVNWTGVGADFFGKGGISGMTYFQNTMTISGNGTLYNSSIQDIGTIVGVAFGQNYVNYATNDINGTIKSIQYWNQDLKNNLSTLTTP